MIVITGAVGFIGSCLLSKLNSEGITDILLVDDFSFENKNKNISNKKFTKTIDRSDFLSWFKNNSSSVSFVYHIGARTDTTEFNVDLFNTLNLNYTKSIWKLCTENNIPLVYASSAATYGLGEFGYDDDEEKIPLLKPLNPYGDSKNDFDNWAIVQSEAPTKWIGFKFFNVYGPNEFHKARMASVIFHSYNQIQDNACVKLFRSHNPKYTDGGQLRDFISVHDVVDVNLHFLDHPNVSGIFNCGTGRAQPFNDVASAVVNTMRTLRGQAPMSLEELVRHGSLRYVAFPEDLKGRYQSYTQADVSALRAAGYKAEMRDVQTGVSEYVRALHEATAGAQ
jgi:ADP-L-glycero-D-manno-heptose 6-epimerase